MSCVDLLQNLRSKLQFPKRHLCIENQKIFPIYDQLQITTAKLGKGLLQHGKWVSGNEVVDWDDVDNDDDGPLAFEIHDQGGLSLKAIAW